MTGQSREPQEFPPKPMPTVNLTFPPTVIVERPFPQPGTPTPFGQLPVGSTVTVRPAIGAPYVFLAYSYDTALSTDQMTDLKTRDTLIRTWVASGAACSITPPEESKARISGYRGDFVHIVVTQGACNRYDGWTRTENVSAS